MDMPLEMEKNPMQQMQAQADRIKKKLGRVKHKVAVVSGKGGVGKTTVAVYLASMLSRSYSVGLLDADIDCSNAGKMLGIDAQFRVEDNRILPVFTNGLKVASMDFLPKNEGTPIIWRGALIHKAILQLIDIVEWGDLDYMIFDMPPGTSDAVLTVLQNTTPDFLVVVTAPSAVSLMDAEKAANMAKQFGMRFGIVENLSGDFFGTGGGEKLAKRLGAPFLGRISMNKSLREACDEGKLTEDKKTEQEISFVVDSLKKQLA